MIDTLSPPGSFRAALAPNASCAACQQAICQHDDLTYAGIAPARILVAREISPFAPAGTPGSGFRHANDIAGFSTVGKRDEARRPITGQFGDEA